ncbi:MAG TPA: OmpH family outer membrane protein [Steroidobacteraceae bacterium]|jgi:outer membrane protein
MSIMTRHSMTGALVLAAALAAPGVAGAAEVKIGYINFGRLLEESPQARAAQQALEGEFLPRQRDVAAQQKSLEEKRDKLKREAAVMSEADRIRSEREVRDLELSVQRRFNELQEDLNLRRNEEIGRMQRALLQEVQAYARANGYQLVVSEGVLFAAEAVDITPQVVAQLKAKAPPAPATPPRT